MGFIFQWIDLLLRINSLLNVTIRLQSLARILHWKCQTLNKKKNANFCFRIPIYCDLAAKMDKYQPSTYIHDGGGG